jgi:hypothetical protein
MEIAAEETAKKDSPECITYLENLYKIADTKEVLTEDIDIYSHNKTSIQDDDFSPINN